MLYFWFFGGQINYICSDKLRFFTIAITRYSRETLQIFVVLSRVEKNVAVLHRVSNISE